MNKLAVQFYINTTSPPIIKACTDMLKSGQRQMRYKLKKKYFYDMLANEVATKSPMDTMTNFKWKELKCTTNQRNHGEVRFHQRTGSRSYTAQAHVVREKHVEQEPTAMDIFKNFHCSKKGLIRVRVETQETTRKAQLEELNALKNTTKKLRSLISSLINFSPN
uniref:Uncharacterized protein n=1 Tax=Setaria italica TaxID=4555 RepID=K3YY62_SETIT